MKGKKRKRRTAQNATLSSVFDREDVNHHFQRWYPLCKEKVSRSFPYILCMLNSYNLLFYVKKSIILAVSKIQNRKKIKPHSNDNKKSFIWPLRYTYNVHMNKMLRIPVASCGAFHAAIIRKIVIVLVEEKAFFCSFFPEISDNKSCIFFDESVGQSLNLINYLVDTYEG